MAPIAVAARPGVEPERAFLRDGTSVRVRAMRETDRARLVRFHERLSDETTYLRFFSVHPHLSPGEVAWFTQVDHRGREAIVATVSGEIVGVARFDRLDDPAEAEVAFVVEDAWQGRGLGSLLFHQLVARAREVGVARFVAETLPRNRRMLAVFHGSGLPCQSSHEDGVVRLCIHLAD
jgi:RimJ/RimL family protein N-acetyltransferase